MPQVEPFEVCLSCNPPLSASRQQIEEMSVAFQQLAQNFGATEAKLTEKAERMTFQATFTDMEASAAFIKTFSEMLGIEPNFNT